MCARTPNLDDLATSANSALFSRFYSAAGVCSPTRAAYLTGRTNERSCIHSALSCDQEDVAADCSQGKGLPWSEFTTAKAAKKSTLGNYATTMIGKWHLGDLWPKTNLKSYKGNYSSPTQHGFDDWMLTQAEASVPEIRKTLPHQPTKNLRRGHRRVAAPRSCPTHSR